LSNIDDKVALNKTRSVLEPHEYDILEETSNGSNLHVGNVYFQLLIESKKDTFTSSSTTEAENSIVSQIIQELQLKKPPGRFLTKDCESGF